MQIKCRVLSYSDSTQDGTKLSLITTRLFPINNISIPSIDIHGYLTRILKYAPCGSECFLAVEIYLSRMCTKRPVHYHQDPNYNSQNSSYSDISNSVDSIDSIPTHRACVTLNAFNIHRLLITGIMIAIKFLSDVFYTNTHVSRTNLNYLILRCWWITCRRTKQTRTRLSGLQ